MKFSNVQSDFYEKVYSDILGSGLIGKFQQFIHTHLEKDLSAAHYSEILELGAGGLEHLKMSRLKYNIYYATDIRYSSNEILNLKKFNTELNLEKVKLIYLDAEMPNLDEKKFDLIIATCVLIHLRDPEIALIQWKKLTKPGGELAIYVPTEPGIFLRLGRRFLIKPKHRKFGIENSDLLYAREHISSFYILNSLIKEVYKNCQIKIRYWPFNFIKSWNLNAAAVYTITIPRD